MVGWMAVCLCVCVCVCVCARERRGEEGRGLTTEVLAFVPRHLTARPFALSAQMTGSIHHPSACLPTLAADRPSPDSPIAIFVKTDRRTDGQRPTPLSLLVTIDCFVCMECFVCQRQTYTVCKIQMMR